MGSALSLIYALHGFLGQGSDWTDVFDHPEFKQHQIITPSFFSDEKYSSLSIQKFAQDVSEIKSKKIFVGYSLGGRIGLQILEQQPDLFDHYIFVSVHPGLKTSEERAVRLQNDKAWLERLQQWNWNQFVQEWNAQGVLNNSKNNDRKATDFKLEQLELGLTKFSLGHQKDYSELIRKYQDRIYWVVGLEDKKFLSLSEELEQKKILLNIKRIFSGHRVLLDNPKDLQLVVKEVVQSLAR